MSAPCVNLGSGGISLVNVKLKHIHFLGNCVIELLGVNLPTAYQHPFIFIRQLATILREAPNIKTKDPEFFEFLKEHDKELLQFSDDNIDKPYKPFASFVQEDVDADMEDGDPQLDEEASEHEIQKKEL